MSQTGRVQRHAEVQAQSAPFVIFRFLSIETFGVKMYNISILFFIKNHCQQLKKIKWSVISGQKKQIFSHILTTEH